MALLFANKFKWARAVNREALRMIVNEFMRVTEITCERPDMYATDCIQLTAFN